MSNFSSLKKHLKLAPSYQAISKNKLLLLFPPLTQYLIALWHSLSVLVEKVEDVGSY